MTWYWGAYRYRGQKETADECIRVNRALNKELMDKNLIISDIMVKVSIDTYDIEDVPFPMGYKIYEPKTNTFRMVRVNNAYKDKYGVSNTMYFGNQDIVFDSENSPEWYKHDLQVISGEPMKPYKFYENSIKGVWSWRKWKVVKNNDIFLYFIEI